MKHFPRFWRSLAAGILTLSGFAVFAAETENKADDMPTVGDAASISVLVKVTGIDKDKHQVTLTGPKGRSFNLAVHDPAKLEAAKVGDQVMVTYREAVALSVKKAGSADVGRKEQVMQKTSKPGEVPAGLMGESIQVVATLTAVDPEKGTATIRSPEGEETTVKVDDPSKLQGIKAGDLVQLTYNRALLLQLVQTK